MPSGQGGGQGGFGGYPMGGGQSNFDAMQAGQGWQTYGNPLDFYGQQGRSRLLDYARMSGWLGGGSGIQPFLPPPVQENTPAPAQPQQAPPQAAPALSEYVDTPWGPRRRDNPATDRMRFGGR